jgi:hypothetical protein
MINCAAAQFVQEPSVKGKELIVLMEITMSNLLAEGRLDAQDFLSRVDLLADIGLVRPMRKGRGGWLISPARR